MELKEAGRPLNTATGWKRNAGLRNCCPRSVSLKWNGVTGEKSQRKQTKHSYFRAEKTEKNGTPCRTRSSQCTFPRQRITRWGVEKVCHCEDTRKRGFFADPWKVHPLSLTVSCAPPGWRKGPTRSTVDFRRKNEYIENMHPIGYRYVHNKYAHISRHIFMIRRLIISGRVHTKVLKKCCVNCNYLHPLIFYYGTTKYKENLK